MNRYVHLKGRLLAISKYVEDSRITADIGCDHGRLSVSLIQSGKAEYVYASDISVPSLKKAAQLCRICNLEDRMDIREADGLTGIPKQPDTIIVAGMGGKLIADILKGGGNITKNAEHIILQPMRGIAPLRQYLYENGFKILRERLCKEAGRIYQIADVQYTGEVQHFSVLPEDFFDIGEYMLKNRDALLPEYVQRLKNELTDAKMSAACAGVNLCDIEKRLSVLNYISEVYYK